MPEFACSRGRRAARKTAALGAFAVSLVVLAIACRAQAPDPADLDATAKRLSEAVGGEWKVERDAKRFDKVAGWPEGEKGECTYQALAFPLDRKGRAKLGAYADLCNAPLVVVGHGRQWTVIAWRNALEPGRAEANAKILKTLGIESRGPEVVGGLSVTISADKGWADPTGKSPQGGLGLPGGLSPSLDTPEYAAGEPIKVAALFHNHTDQAIRIRSTRLMAARVLPMWIEVGGKGTAVETQDVEFPEIPAKGARMVWIMLYAQDRPGAIGSLAARTDLPPGDHLLRLVFRFDAKDAGEGFWSGELRSNEVPFGVAAPPAPVIRENGRMDLDAAAAMLRRAVGGVWRVTVFDDDEKLPMVRGEVRMRDLGANAPFPVWGTGLFYVISLPFEGESRDRIYSRVNRFRGQPLTLVGVSRHCTVLSDRNGTTAAAAVARALDLAPSPVSLSALSLRQILHEKGLGYTLVLAFLPRGKTRFDPVALAASDHPTRAPFRGNPREVRASAAEVLRMVDYLVDHGLVPAAEATEPATDGCSAVIGWYQGNRWTCDLGSDARTLAHLTALRACVQGEAADAMDALVGRLASQMKSAVPSAE